MEARERKDALMRPVWTFTSDRRPVRMESASVRFSTGAGAAMAEATKPTAARSEKRILMIDMCLAERSLK
jgi:hypothetical protein